jgi:hypothetical protein
MRRRNDKAAILLIRCATRTKRLKARSCINKGSGAIQFCGRRTGLKADS